MHTGRAFITLASNSHQTLIQNLIKSLTKIQVHLMVHFIKAYYLCVLKFDSFITFYDSHVYIDDIWKKGQVKMLHRLANNRHVFLIEKILIKEKEL